MFADKQAALDAVTAATAHLSDDARIRRRSSRPGAGDAIARFYASSAGAQTALGAAKSTSARPRRSGSLTSANVDRRCADLAGRRVQARGAREGGKHDSAAGEQLRSSTRSRPVRSSRSALNGGGAVVPASAQQQLSALGQQLGIDLPALVSALNGPVIAYVRPGIPLPEVTIAARPTSRSARRRRSAALIARFAKGAKAVPTPVDGGTLNKVDLGPVASTTA